MLALPKSPPPLELADRSFWKSSRNIARATFFMIGELAGKHAKVVRMAT